MYILDQFLALIFDVFFQSLLEIRGCQDRLGGKEMIIADVLNEALGLFQQLCLRVFYADGGVNIPEPPVHLKQSSHP